jgi:hypothetical protein
MMKNVNFLSQGLKLAGHLYIPDNKASGKLPSFQPLSLDIQAVA